MDKLGEKCIEHETPKVKMPILPLNKRGDVDDCAQTGSGKNGDFIQERYAKLSVNMKNYCDIHLRLSQRINNNDFNGLKLNPECQIKILEENLSFLFNKNSRCSFFQVKSSSGVFNTSSHLLNVNRKCLEPTPCHFKNETDFTIKFSGKESNFLEGFGKIDKVEHCETKRDDESKSSMFHFLQTNETKKLQKKINKTTPTLLRKKHTVTKRDVASNFEIKPLDLPKQTNDSDNSFEFTVEGEKIVSFVCSPTPSRKQKAKKSNYQNLPNESTDLESDMESENGSEVSATKSNSISETTSTNSFKIDKNDIAHKNDLVWSQPQVYNKLLWHPAFTQQNCLSPSISKRTTCNEGQISCFDNSQGPNLQQNMETSLSRETTLFREMSLRSCYTMENILSRMKPTPPLIQQEVKRVKESLFSAINAQDNTDKIVVDNMQSVLDIFKSWVKLNSYFQNKDFKAFLEQNGFDQSVMNDFLQWQCVSRVFVDKIVQLLNNISPGQNDVSDPAALRKDFCQNLSSIQRHSGYEMSPQFHRGMFGVTNDKDSSLSKYWKQRRFSSDQAKQEFSGTPCNRPVQPKASIGKNYTQNNAIGIDTYHESILLSNQDSELNLCSFDRPGPKKISRICQDSTSIPLNSNVRYQCPLTSSTLSQSDYIHRPPLHGGFCNFNSDANLYNLGPLKGVSTIPALTFPTPLGTSISPTFPVVPNMYKPIGLSSNLVHPNCNTGSSLKQNPIPYIDTEVSDNCAKISYMKPGSYNPPQKPSNFQPVVNNNFPIEDPPVVGIPFVYNGNQQPVKAPNLYSSWKNKDYTENDSYVKSPEECWQAALSSAEIFRNSLTESKPVDGPNLKLSDTVSMKTHFLLGDEKSQDSSSIDLKFGSDNDEQSRKDDLTSQLGMAVVETQFKTTDWLIKSFEDREERHSAKTNIFGENDVSCKIPYHNELCVLPIVDNKIDRPMKRENSTHSFCDILSPSSSGSDCHNSDSIKSNVSAEPTQILKKSEDLCDNKSKNMTRQKQRKQIKKNNEDYALFFDPKSSFMLRKPKSIFKRAITKEVTFKLENILNCIWNTKVPSLIEEVAITERDASRLEVKIRSPLYFQALKCKLMNHSYDTLDQALADIQQYFSDTKNRNKGDKQCVNAIDILEQVFLDLVQSHFGIMYHPRHKNLGPIGLNSNKPRRPKKAIRK